MHASSAYRQYGLRLKTSLCLPQRPPLLAAAARWRTAARRLQNLQNVQQILTHNQQNATSACVLSYHSRVMAKNPWRSSPESCLLYERGRLQIPQIVQATQSGSMNNMNTGRTIKMHFIYSHEQRKVREDFSYQSRYGILAILQLQHNKCISRMI